MITLKDAKRIIEAAEAKAAEIGQPMNIAVADAGGNLISHVRMDGCIARLHRHLHQEGLHLTRLRHRDQRPGHAFAIRQPVSSSIHASNDGKIMIFAGGIPLKQDGKVVGAIGVSGGSGDQDHAVAEAGAAAL